MKNIFICSILLSMIFSYNTGYSGMYFSDGFTISGSYSNQEEDGEESDALGLGFSYLLFQEKSNSSDRPTLAGTYEISGFYNSIDTDGLNMKMLSMGLGYYLNKLRFGLNYETLLDYSGDDVDFLNGLSNNTFEMSGSATTFSIGTFKVFKMTNFDCIPILDLMTVKSKLTMSYTNPGNGIEYTDENDGSANLLRLGVGFKMNNIVIQPTVVLNEDKEKRYSISAIFKL